MDKISDFDWDSGNWAKCGSHGVGRNEIEKLFSLSPAILDYPFPGEPRKRAIGKVGKRYIFLVFMFRNSDSEILIRPISARYMHRKEIEHRENIIAKKMPSLRSDSKAEDFVANSDLTE